MNWAEFAEAAPELARLAQERFDKAGLALVGTIRRDGTPRISPIEPAIFEGMLLLGMMHQSRKALDLLRDPRCVLHTIITDKEGTEGEIKLRARAFDVTDRGLRERHAQDTFDRTGWRPEEPFHLFSLDIEDAAFVQYHGGERQTVKIWHAGEPERTRIRKWTGSGYADD
ncbi:MAG TPA: pyridoxamine 5'-phosphate oxidase family protein [Dehalococcoidia bacterium]|jgi:hypothetical protein|nr:pyridoxamine 5'-phosphate oxidase family protein [Dehalococcoidia bacterium]